MSTTVSGAPRESSSSLSKWNGKSSKLTAGDGVGLDWEIDHEFGAWPGSEGGVVCGGTFDGDEDGRKRGVLGGSGTFVATVSVVSIIGSVGDALFKSAGRPASVPGWWALEVRQSA